MSSGRGRHSGQLTAAAVLLLISGCAVWLLQSPTVSTADIPGAAATPSGRGAGDLGAIPTAKRASWEPGAPRRVVIPRLQVDTAVVPIKAPNDTLIPPADPLRLGWWAGGARPGAATGSALVTGHTVHTGGGALDELETLERGDRVLVRTDHRRIRYRVSDVEIFSKGAVARHAERLFDQDVPGRLVLITCEEWDGTRYLSNVVVTAIPSG